MANDFEEGFLARLRAGEAGAVDEVFGRFTDRLLALARQQLEPRVRAKVDPEDIVQSVYRSFFTRCRTGEFHLNDWGAVWALLTVITLRKCANQAEYFRAGRRDADREVPLDAGRSAARWRELLDREPTPEQAAVLRETVEQLMRGLGADERSVVELSLQGWSTQEISQELGRAERSVRRVRQFIRRRLERLQAELD